MSSIKICAVQLKIYPNFCKNLRKVEKFIKTAADNECDIICFPEVFLTGPLNRDNYDNEVPLEAKKMFSKLSKKYNIYSIMGSIIEKIGMDLFNISYLFDDKGCIIGNYKKNHLVEKSEASYLTPGHDVSVFKTKIGNIGIEICRDLLYPEITRKMMLKNAEIIFCPSFWCAKSRSYKWVYNNKYFKHKKPKEVDAIASSRAIESETVIVYVNGASNFIDGHNRDILLGRTQIALPFYGTTNILKHNREGFIIKELDLNIVKDAKKVYNIEADLKEYDANNKV